MSEFTVTGSYQARDGWQPFEKVLEAENEDVAVEHTYAELGSNFGLKRTQIEISEARSASSSRTQSDEEVAT